jgi:hypothetical protein
MDQDPFLITHFDAKQTTPQPKTTDLYCGREIVLNKRCVGRLFENGLIGEWKTNIRILWYLYCLMMLQRLGSILQPNLFRYFLSVILLLLLLLLSSSR